MNTILGGVSIIMIETILSIGLGVVVFGVLLLSTRFVYDSRLDEIETERYKEVMKYTFP